MLRFRASMMSITWPCFGARAVSPNKFKQRKNYQLFLPAIFDPDFARKNQPACSP
jgi:hypothetical protein